MKYHSQSFFYDDPWAIVSLAYFLRYPNPYASHIISCDVISRSVSPSGNLHTTRLILKRGSLPRWAPKGIISRAESWSTHWEKTLRCTTKNLEFTKVMKMEESVFIRQTEEGKTIQTTEARVFSGFGWGLTKRIESHGLNRFKAHVQRSREGVSVILNLIRESRLQLHPMTLGGDPNVTVRSNEDSDDKTARKAQNGTWARMKGWFSNSKG
ncbi:PRELI-like family-domain-containing protein [Rhodocollybia butyracea]|uniref:PRELI-like family-domain-containing protein n=1 Tax=Rhodocollybia butyracea TaxID=206335 RepID=A0A9P5PMK5_9AGAR|nr:PRELI-like family-domain-containing protein [Rhodocollybia butyracea]